MVTLANPVARQLIRAVDVANITGFILGTAGYGQLFRPNDISDATNYGTIIGNQDSTNGRALRITYGPTASATTIAQFTKLGFTLAQIGASADPGAGLTTVYTGTDGRLYIFPGGGSATRLGTYAEIVAASTFVPGTPVTAQASGNLTLSTTATDVAGMFLSLGVGKYFVTADYYWTCTGAGDVGFTFGGLVTILVGTGTVTYNGTFSTFTPAANGQSVTTSKSWYVNVTSAPVTLSARGFKTGGTGTSTLNATHSTLTAALVSN